MPLKIFLSYFYVYINIVALILSLYYMYRGKHSLKYIVGFLLVAVVFETWVVDLFSKVYGNNFFAYQWFTVFCVAYYFFLYIDWFKDKAVGRYLRWIFGVWLLFAVVYNFVMVSQEDFNIMPYNVGMFLIAVFILKYLYDIIYIDSYREVFKEPLFYFSVGILLFYVCNFSILVLMNEVTLRSGNMFYQNLLQLGNILLSLGYLGTVLCSKKISQI